MIIQTFKRRNEMIKFILIPAILGFIFFASFIAIFSQFKEFYSNVEGFDSRNQKKDKGYRARVGMFEIMTYLTAYIFATTFCFQFLSKKINNV